MRTFTLFLLLLIASIAVDAQTLYITKTGSKYHTGSCRYLSKSKIPIYLEDAINRGYTPCSVCKPPTKVKSTGTNKTGANVVYITTIIDGTDIGRVNLWDHRTERNNIVTSCVNNQKVIVLQDDGDYVKLKTSDRKAGWCMKGFIKINFK